MANVIVGGPDVMNALIYPDQNPVNMGYFQQAVYGVNDRLTEVGRQFMSGAKEIYEKVNSSEALRIARAAIRAAKGMFHPNQIVPLETIEDLQSAQPMMQRWIMAQPDIRHLYHEQRCDGFSETYVDLAPNDIGESHYDYRRVMNGMVQEDERGSWFVREYPDELVEGDRELIFGERTDIIKTWDLIQMFVEAGEQDPTDPYGGNL